MLIIFGPAGSGKTLLVKEFGDWLSENYKVGRINLDPGAEWLGYKANFDLRNFFTVKEIMKEKNLGPNGAMIEAMRMMNENIDKVMSGIDEVVGDYILLDTPGQNEIWLFQELDRKIVKRLEKGIGIFLMDAELCKEPKNLLLNLLFSLMIKLRFGMPTINIFNKIDLLNENEIIQLKKNFENPIELVEQVKGKSSGMIVDVISNLSTVIGLRAERFIPISCLKKENFQLLQDIIYEVHCVCGDLT
ncbi:MAG: ATP/GTP-binding protein [Candidatus Thermoplasmatota archaeon]|nr:ATP/GTP-binding protein [Candidatus Thermoplasmatota archaeon]